MTRSSTLTIALLYPELLGTYGDRGNALVLRERLRQRGLPAEILDVSRGQPAPRGADVYVLGGGEDAEQGEALIQLQRSTGFASAVAAGAPVLAVCAGLQLLGQSVEQVDGTLRAGLGLLDAATTRLPVRAVGDVVALADPELALPPLVGFENHQGGTRLGPAARALAMTTRGTGNGTADRAEGAQQDGIVATYLHGPVLAVNPSLADLLLTRAVGRPLPPLEMASVEALRADRLREVDGAPLGNGFEAVSRRLRVAARRVAGRRGG